MRLHRNYGKFRLAVVALVCGAVPLVGTASAGAASAAGAADTANAETRPGLRESVGAAMLERGRAEASPLVRSNAGTEVNVQRQDDGYAFGSGVLLAPPSAEAPDSWLFVARRTAAGWRVGLEGTPAFSSLVASAPESVVSKGEKTTFVNNARNRVLATPTGLALPYALGNEWKIIGGPHGWSGQPRPWSSIDLDSRGTDRNVLAAQSGRAYWMCSNGGHIRIVHDNGWTTEYYHLLDEIRPNGDPIKLGDYLGRTSTRIPCGGSAGSNHVHFALKRDGSWSALFGKTIGGWTYFEGSSAYGGGGCRGNDCRYVGDWLYNYGPEDGRIFWNTNRFDIPDLGRVESPISVTGLSGNAPSNLRVFVDAHHTWRGDLRIDLVSPNGTVLPLRAPRSSDDGDILHETYVVNASAHPANGTWKLRVEDTDDNDTGHLAQWSLTYPNR